MKGRVEVEVGWWVGRRSLRNQVCSVRLGNASGVARREGKGEKTEKLENEITTDSTKTELKMTMDV